MKLPKTLKGTVAALRRASRLYRARSRDLQIVRSVPPQRMGQMRRQAARVRSDMELLVDSLPAFGVPDRQCTAVDHATRKVVAEAWTDWWSTPPRPGFTALDHLDAVLESLLIRARGRAGDETV